MALPVGRLIVGFRNNIRQGCDRRHDTYDPSRKRRALRVRLLHQICRFGVKAKSLTIVGRFDPVALQDFRDGAARDAMTEIDQRALDAPVAPVAILVG